MRPRPMPPTPAAAPPAPTAGEALAARIRQAAAAFRAERTHGCYAALYGAVVPVLAVAMRARGVPPVVAEEACQEMLGEIWATGLTLDALAADPLAWLADATTVVGPRALGREGEAREAVEAVAREAMLHPAPGPEAAVADAQRDAALVRAVAALPPELAGPLRMAFVQGLSRARIAAATGVPTGTVKARVRQAMAALRDALARDPALAGGDEAGGPAAAAAAARDQEDP